MTDPDTARPGEGVLLTETSAWGVGCFWLRNGLLYCAEVKLVDRNVSVLLGGSGLDMYTVHCLVDRNVYVGRRVFLA